MRVTCIALAASGLAVATAWSAEPTFSREFVPGTRHAVGEARWSDEVQREFSPHCEGIDRPLTRVPAFDCVANTLFLRNESALPLQCHLVLEYPDPDIEGQKVIERDVVIYPEVKLGSLHSYSPAANAPTRFASSCKPIPATPAPFTPRPDCKLSYETPRIHDFYPPASRRRGEEGTVTLEFSIDAGTRRAQNAQVVDISSFAALDNAALDVLRHTLAETNCYGERFRMKINFRTVDP